MQWLHVLFPQHHPKLPLNVGVAERCFLSSPPRLDYVTCAFDFRSACPPLTSQPSGLSSAIDCVMSDWTEWSECNKSCGKGHTIRTRTLTLEPQFGGDPCSETIQRKKCKIRKCNRGQANSDEKRRRKEQREKRRSKQDRAEVTSQHPGWHHRHHRMEKSTEHSF